MPLTLTVGAKVEVETATGSRPSPTVMLLAEIVCAAAVPSWYVGLPVGGASSSVCHARGGMLVAAAPANRTTPGALNVPAPQSGICEPIAAVHDVDVPLESSVNDEDAAPA